MFQKIINFIKYHNAFTIGLALMFVFSGVIFASDDVRETVFGEEIITQTGVDNARILSVDLENFDLGLQITKVNEDEENYYVDYIYKTLGIKDSVWQLVVKEKHLTVSKQTLEDRDLGLYLIEELGEVADYELSYLKEVQTAEQEKGISKLTATIDYTGLIGLVLDVKEKVLPGYEPVIPEPKPEICDGIDNDLDNEIDEDLAVVAGKDIGQCRLSITECIDGQMVQTQTEIGPIDEICGDGIDNNCDGETDEGCCLPSTEICNNRDDDCDGLVDEYLGQISCGTGVCFRVINVCAGGVIQTCIPGIPSAEICDNIDNDCDGLVDEDNVCQPAVPPPSAPVCDADNLNLCLTELDCSNASGFWYNDICNTQAQELEEPLEEPPVEVPTVPVCDSENLDLCDTEVDCQIAEGFWWSDNTCNLEIETPASSDTTAPEITLLGNVTVNINVDDVYNDAGATASDDVDGNITDQIVVINPVDISAAGAYTVTYNISDAAGNAATEVTRTVMVNVAAPSDTDGDGVVDSEDACPDIAGDYCHGCPHPDCSDCQSPACPETGQPICQDDNSLCSAPNAIGICQEGVCVFTCNEGYEKDENDENDENDICQPVESVDEEPPAE
ncbi:DUF5011 domain-containing protein [Candidatus Parcubacteria bacterium]|nr:DUF5011 domain-containing protein [Candidatus Parcubacteria bacterium]